MSQPAPPGTGRLIRSGRAAARLLLVWLAATVTLLVLDDLMAGFVLNSRWLALLIALCLGLLYALVWPLIMRVALGFTVITLGLGGFLLSGLLVLAVFVAVPGAQIRGLPTAVLIAGWLTVRPGSSAVCCPSTRTSCSSGERPDGCDDAPRDRYSRPHLA